MKTHIHQHPVSPLRWGIPAIILATIATADEAATHRFDAQGAHQPAGSPEPTSKILAIAEKPVALHFTGLPADWQPVVHIDRITAVRRIELPTSEAEFTGDVWLVTWTPPETRRPAQYEIRLEGEPTRVVRIETRDPAWLEAARDALANAEWQAQGLTTEERAALATFGIQTQASKATTATLQMRPRKTAAARRRIVWDEENPTLLVWRPGPSAGDLEARSPRWWISPESLATDHGLIRFLDLFSEPPLNP